MNGNIKNLVKDLNDPIGKEELEVVLNSMKEMALEDHPEIEEALPAIELCVATIENKSVIVVANVALALILALPVNVLEGFKGTIPDIINQKVMREFKGLLDNLKDKENNE